MIILSINDCVIYHSRKVVECDLGPGRNVLKSVFAVYCSIISVGDLPCKTVHMLLEDISLPLHFRECSFFGSSIHRHICFLVNPSITTVVLYGIAPSLG